MPDLTPSPAPIKAEGVGTDSAVNATVAVPTDSHGGWGTAALKIATLPLQAVGFLTVKPFEMAYHHFFPVKDDLEYDDGFRGRLLGQRRYSVRHRYDGGRRLSQRRYGRMDERNHLCRRYG